MFMVGAMLSKHIDEYLTLFSDLKGVIPIFFSLLQVSEEDWKAQN